MCEYPQRVDLRDKDKDSEKGSLSKNKMVFDSEKGFVGYKRNKSSVGLLRPLVASKSKSRFNWKLYQMGSKAQQKRSKTASWALGFSPLAITKKTTRMSFLSTVFSSLVNVFKLKVLNKLRDLTVRKTRSRSLTQQSFNPFYVDEQEENKVLDKSEHVKESSLKRVISRCASVGSECVAKRSSKRLVKYQSAPLPPTKDLRLLPLSSKRKNNSNDERISTDVSDVALDSCEAIYSQIEQQCEDVMIDEKQFYFDYVNVCDEDYEESVMSDWSDLPKPLLD